MGRPYCAWTVHERFATLPGLQTGRNVEIHPTPATEPECAVDAGGLENRLSLYLLMRNQQLRVMTYDRIRVPYGSSALDYATEICNCRRCPRRHDRVLKVISPRPNELLSKLRVHIANSGTHIRVLGTCHVPFRLLMAPGHKTDEEERLPVFVKEYD